MERVAVGCAGWSIPAEHRGLFDDGDNMLARYATRFRVTEINSSFYRPHRPDTYARWAASVPAHFRFSVKIPRLISHELALRQCGPALDRFLAESGNLGSKLGGYLLQLPPSQILDMRVAATFFAMFRRRSTAPLVCEPRHPSWFTGPAEALLQRYGVSRVATDPPVVADALHPGPQSAWPYWRWHGSPRMYYSAYSETALQALAAEVRDTGAASRRTWVMFDNTAHGFAVANAARLQELLPATTGKQRKRIHA